VCLRQVIIRILLSPSQFPPPPLPPPPLPLHQAPSRDVAGTLSSSKSATFSKLPLCIVALASIHLPFAMCLKCCLFLTRWPVIQTVIARLPPSVNADLDHQKQAAVAIGGGSSVSVPPSARLPDSSPQRSRIIEYQPHLSKLHAIVIFTRLFRSPPPSAFADLVEEDLQQVCVQVAQ
jgi:hypothetical protein